MESKYGVKEILELFVFDMDGNLVVELDTLVNSRIIADINCNRIIAVDALLNLDLLRFQQNSNEEDLSDYELTMREINKKPITFNVKNRSKACKLVAKTEIRELGSEEDIEVYFDIPNAEIVSGFDMDIVAYDTSQFDVIFDIKPDENGDLFSVHGL